MNPKEAADQEFDRVADAVLRRLERAVDGFDPDEVESQLAGDVLTLTLGSGTRIIINRHRAAGQIWMASARKAWHFDPVPGTERWEANKGQDELVATLEAVLSAELRRPITLPAAH